MEMFDSLIRFESSRTPLGCASRKVHLKNQQEFVKCYRVNMD